MKSLERNEKFKPSKRRINKVISLLTSEEFQILPQNVVKRKQIIAEIKTSSNQPNVTFSINKYHFMGIADSGSYFSILPYASFQKLNINETSLDCKQQYSIHSATDVKENAVLGTIFLTVSLQNKDGSVQNLHQHFFYFETYLHVKFNSARP